MPRPKSNRPAYCLHRQSGRGYVTIDGQQKLLPGLHNSSESRVEYDRLVGLWLANGRSLPEQPDAPTGPTVSMIVLAFWRHAQAFYVDANGKPTGEAENFRAALLPLRLKYGPIAAMEFGPKKLKTLRASMLLPQPVIDSKTKQSKMDKDKKPVMRAGWSRTYANRQADRIKHLFRWAASEEMIPASVPAALDTVEGIRRGRDGARETKPVGPVAGEIVEQTIAHLPPPVAAMVKLQLLTGARGGELFPLRTCDIDRSGPVWKAKPEQHKTSHHGKPRTIRFGPRAQKVLAPLFKLDLQAPIFSPADAHAWRSERLAKARKTPITPSQKLRAENAARRSRKLNPIYNKSTYARAIARVCKRECIPAWHPHQLRHTSGTTYRRESDLETTATVLGHAKVSMTEQYAERDDRKADEVVARIG